MSLDLSLAPQWATHYFIEFDKLYFCSTQFYCLSGTNHKLPNKVGIGSFAVELPKREFDIGKFTSSLHPSDEPYVSAEDNLVVIDGKINKDWAIAIARHFKLSESDLR